MLTNWAKRYYWKTNAKEFLGYQPGMLVVTRVETGGGFSGAPQVIHLGLAEGVAPGQETPEPEEFPPPSNSIEYRIGGNLFTGYHYKKEG